MINSNLKKCFAMMILAIMSFSVLAELPKERRLKKLSMHLRGVNPSIKEYDEISKVKNEDINSFFKEKTSEYLASSEHIEKMNLRINQLFRFGLPQYFNDQLDRHFVNSTNSLFRDITRKNKSWDSLLTGKEYRLSMTSEGSGQKNDFGFFGAVLQNKDYPQLNSGILNTSNEIFKGEESQDTDGNTYEENTEFVHKARFEDSDLRIAGAITTQRFFDRYVNTGINKNRKRAAAVFRIFLCDDMEAAIADNSDRTDYILDFVFPDTTGMSSGDVSNISLGDSAHGQRPDCMACHYKLDPLGKNFGGSGVSLAPMSFKGGLHYRTIDGEDISIPTDGIGELASAIVKQKDYKRCQTKQFWTWFVGEDRYLAPDTHEELIQEYNKVDGRVNDFISYIVNRKEFYDKKTLSSEAKLAFKVKSTLKNCNSCHDKEGIPRFTDWPIQDDNGDMKYWLGKIDKSLGLGGGERSMPPKSHMWQPSEEELTEINDWIRIGAPNENGNRQIP